MSLCACGSKDTGEKERECGVYITMEANDVFTVSCGTDEGSDSFKNADESAIAAGTVIHLTLPVIRPTAPKKPISNTASAFMTRT